MKSPAVLICFAFAASMIAGCAMTGAIQPVSASKSGFDGAVYSGETSVMNAPTPKTEVYRVFNQGATGFVSLEANREDAESRATQFCSQRQQAFLPLQGTVSKPPYILGNLPRVEIVFECVPKEVVAQQSPVTDKYTKLAELKRLLDDGALTQAEFEKEKNKLLSGR